MKKKYVAPRSKVANIRNMNVLVGSDSTDGLMLNNKLSDDEEDSSQDNYF